MLTACQLTFHGCVTLMFVYKIIHIYVALIGIEIWDISDQIEVVSDFDKLIQRFVEWKKTNLLPRKHHDNAQFITNVDFDGTTIGYAQMSAMCDPWSAAIIQDMFVVAAGVGATIAHEMGHNLGMGHDRPGCTCEANSCIMAPAISNDIPLLFSSCSISDLGRFIYDKYPDCMLNTPVLTEILTPPICGNRFTESGEECDCGEPQKCTDVCCDPYTCKLKPGYECSEGPCCRKCKFKPGGSVCRPAKDQCDIADLCDGNSTTCAKNSFRMNGYPCMDGKGACYKGRCPLMNDQCAAIWGEQATAASDHCFDINTKGNHMGYCTKEGDTYIACENKDKKCGVLYCVGGQNVPRLSGVTVTFGTCKTLLYEGGMVNSGTKCNDIEARIPQKATEARRQGAEGRQRCPCEELAGAGRCVLMGNVPIWRRPTRQQAVCAQQIRFVIMNCSVSVNLAGHLQTVMSIQQQVSSFWKCFLYGGGHLCCGCWLLTSEPELCSQRSQMKD